jgi:hypothetical protein
MKRVLQTSASMTPPVSSDVVPDRGETGARMSSPYQCPRHNVALVARVLVVFCRRKACSFRRNVRYFACPAAGCEFKKPDKWAKRKRYDKEN